MRLKQSTAVALSVGPFVDPTDGVTLVTGLVSALDHASTGIKLSKNGGALTIRHATVTASSYDGYGNYIVTLDTTDTNTLGTLRMQFAAAASCVPVWMDFEVVNANEWDSSFGTSVRKFADLDQIKTVSQSATDLKDFADTGYDPSTHKVAGVVLTDTVTTYTGNTPQTGDCYPKVDTEIATIISVLGTPAGASVSVDIAAVKAVDDAIKVKTDNLPGDPADESLIIAATDALSVKLDTIDDFLDTEVVAIKNKTDNLPSDPADQSAVEAAILAALNTATIPEPTGVVSATPTIVAALGALIMALREKVIVDSGAGEKIYHNAANTALAKKVITDDGTTYTETKMQAP